MLESEDAIAKRYDEAVQAKAKELADALGLPSEALEKLVDYSGAIAVVCEPLSGGIRPGSLYSLNTSLRLVIRDDLLEPIKFFILLIKGCASLSTAVAGLLTGGAQVTAVGVIASSISDLYDLFSKIWARAHRLAPLQWAVVWELRSAKRATIGELATRLPQIAPVDIEATLLHFLMSDKAPENFTREKDGQWELIGV